MHHALCKADNDGRLSEATQPIVTIRADVGDHLEFVIYADTGVIGVPLSEIERAIALAKQEVHSEDFYD